MRVLFVTWAWPSHFFPAVQLGWAARAAGHEVLVASQPSLTTTIVAAGLPAAAVGRDVDVSALAGRYFAWLVSENRPVEWDETRKWGAGNVISYKRMAEAMLPDTLALAQRWRPDLIVHDPTTYAGPLVAAKLGIPAVRHLWGMDFTYRYREFEPAALADLCAELGLGEVETLGDLTLDPCPPSLQVEAPVERLPMRFVPYNGRATLAPEILEPRSSRPRICVVESSAVSTWGGPETALTPLVLDALGRADVELLCVNGSGLIADPPPNARMIDRAALRLLLPSCDLLIHQGGGGAVMTSIAAGTPQLILSRFTDHVFNGRRIAAAGAGREVFAGWASPGLVLAETERILGTSSYRDTAAALQREMRAQWPADRVIDRLAEVVAPS